MFMPKKITIGEAKGQEEIEELKVLKDVEEKKTASEKQIENLNKFLVVVDVFSRYAWVRQIPDKKSNTVIKAFEDIFKTSNRRPKKLWTDRGGEFTGMIDNKEEKPKTDFQCPHCKKYVSNKSGLTQHINRHCPVLFPNKSKEEKLRLKGDIEMYHSEGQSKTSLAESFIKTIKNKIGRWMTENNSIDYLPHLQYLVDEYNGTKHSVFKLQYSPKQASEPKNEEIIYKKYFEHAKPRKPREDRTTQREEIKKGDWVRLSRIKVGFEKGFTPNWTKELFKIRKIKDTDPTTYYLSDANEHHIIGAFYRPELQKSDFNVKEWMGYKEPRIKQDVRLGMEAVQKERDRQKEKKQRQTDRKKKEKGEAPADPQPSTSQQKQNFRCEYCGKFFSSKKGVKKHQNTKACPVLKNREKQQSAGNLDISNTVKNLPIKSLTNFEIEDICKNLKGWRGVFSRDALPSKPRMFECGILNLDDTAGPGTHWTCWHRNKKLKFYFDSYGLPPPLEFQNYMKSPILYSSDKIQDPSTVICGHLCIHVLEKLNEGYHIQPVVNHLMSLKEKGLL